MRRDLLLSPRGARWAAAGLLAAAGVAVAACGSTTDLGVGASAMTTPPTVAAKATGTVNTTPAPPTVPTTAASSPPTTATVTAESGAPTTAAASGGAGPSGTPGPTGSARAATTAGAPCSLSVTGTSQVPINEVCSATGAPHFDTPQAAMTYLANAWNAGSVQQIDYVTDPNGRAQLDSMAQVLVNLRFEQCTPNPGGDYACFFMHDIVPSTSPTTYPNPMNYPPGEAVFTVAPAATPGWYLTEVIHCG